MFYIFLELPYERQLKRIDNNCVEKFKSDFEQECIANGASFFSSQSCLVCAIADDVLASYFSVSRFLFKLNGIMEKYYDRIREVRCVVKYYTEEKRQSEFSYLFFEFKKMIIPEYGIFIFEDALGKLEKYLSFKELKGGLFTISDFPFFNKISKNENAVNENLDTAQIIVHKNDNYFWSLYNFILLNPLSEKELAKLSENDKKILNETKSSFVFLKKYRFTKEMPQYFIDAFLSYCGVYLKAFNKYKNKSIEILVDNINDERNFSEAEKILLANKTAMIHNLDADMPSVYSIPEDLLELVYIILLSGKYCFHDELSEFLSSLNKSDDFFDDVYEWMHSVGLILFKNNICAICYGLIEIIERRIAKNKKNIELYIAEFLWQKYKKGELSSCTETETVFNSLNFELKPEFFVGSIFNKFSDSLMEGVDLKKYKNQSFYESLKYYQQALIPQSGGSINKAYPLAKTALTIFQDSKFIHAEYRALSLIASFNLSQNKCSDALTYFLYCLDNAEQSKDSNLICEALFNTSVAYFLDNNLKQSMVFLKKLANTISTSFEQRWRIPCLFMQGKIYLQIGEFETAQEIFSRAADFAELYFENLIPVCRVWEARALMYNDESKKASKILYKYIDDTDDALLFLLESYLLAPVLKKDFAELDIDLENIYTDYADNGFNELKNIKSGFSFAEDLIWYKIYDEPVGKKLFMAFYNYYNFRINFSKNDEQDICKKYLDELEVLAMDSLYQKDIFSSLYLFLCYDLYSISQGETTSSATAYLSKSFKAMQKNVLSLGENDIRDKYMRKNLWNKKLFEVAKAHKLI